MRDRADQLAEGRTLLALLACALCGCGGSSRPAVTAPSALAEQAKCQIAASQDNPLVTEWPASEKANLEARLREGGVVVAYSGCDMRLLPQCRAAGRYAWRRTTTATDVIEIHDADELYAKLPLGAVSLESELERSGRLAVQTTVSGQLELGTPNVGGIAAQPACFGATHVVSALSIGAFKLRSGGSVAARAGADVAGIGAGSAGTTREELLVRQAGDQEACKLGTDEAPHPECRSPIQVFLAPLPESVVDRGAAGTVKVRFLASEGDRTWNVLVGDREICETPCARWIDPTMPYAMHSEAPFYERDHRIDVPDLRAYGEGPLEVRASPRSFVGEVGGLTLASLGGIGTLTGMVLIGVGCFGNEDELCTPGIVTLPIGAALLAPGIWLIFESQTDVTVGGPKAKQPARLGVGGTF